MREVDNKMMRMGPENAEKPDQLFKVLMIFINVQQNTNFWPILHNGAITFICLNDQPFAFTISCIANFPSWISLVSPAPPMMDGFKPE